MPSSFPFFRLPFLIQLLVLKNLGLLELFYMSLISKRSKQIVTSLNLTLSKLYWDLVSILPRTIVLFQPNDIGLSLCFHFNDTSNVRTPSKRINVNGAIVPVAVRRERNGFLNYLDIHAISERELWEFMDKFTERVLELFKVSKYEIRLSVLPNLRSWFMWKHTERFEKVEVLNWGVTGRLTSDDVKFMLEELTIEDELDIRGFVEEGVRYSGPLKMKRLHAGIGEWLTMEGILNMDCEKAFISCENTITYQDLNAIIKKWLAGGLNNLKHIGICDAHQFQQDARNTQLDRVLEEIVHFPWDANNRPENVIVDYSCRRYYYYFRDGRDIRRSDGTIATVDFTHNGFVFYIWDCLSVNQ